jgi:uncharacterized protein (DUF2141 family)
MKRTIWAMATAGLLFGGAAAAGEVTIELNGVQARGGTLYASLQKRDEFMKQGAGHGAKAIAPKAGVLRLTLPDVAPGEYALSVMHDANDDRQLNMSPQFIPLEGWAMSNGDALMGPPTFDLVKVTVPASGGTVRATVQYYDGKMPTR